MKISFVIPVAAALLLSGCILIPVPRTFVSAPQVSGRLVDSTSRVAVQGAAVYFEGRTDSQVTTDHEGRFTLRREHDLVLFGIATSCPVYKVPEPRAFPGALVVQDARYGSVTIRLKPYYDQTRFDPKDLKVDLGEVGIERNNAPKPAAGRKDVTS